jgi:hypothetical protein
MKLFFRSWFFLSLNLKRTRYSESEPSQRYPDSIAPALSFWHLWAKSALLLSQAGYAFSAFQTEMSAAQSGAAALLGASKHAAVLLSSTEVPGSVATTVGVVGFAAWWLLSSSGDKYLGRRNKKYSTCICLHLHLFSAMTQG